MEAFRFLLIHLVVPASGFLVFERLNKSMLKAQVEHPPLVPLLVIFATYGGWLMIVLTELFWYWSGMASLGAAYLILIAPIAMTVMAVILYRQRRLSRYHFGAFIASGLYPLVIGALAIVKFV